MHKKAAGMTVAIIRMPTRVADDNVPPVVYPKYSSKCPFNNPPIPKPNFRPNTIEANAKAVDRRPVYHSE